MLSFVNVKPKVSQLFSKAEHNVSFLKKGYLFDNSSFKSISIQEIIKVLKIVSV